MDELLSNCPIDLGLASSCAGCVYAGECFDGPSNEEVNDEDIY